MPALGGIMMTPDSSPWGSPGVEDRVRPQEKTTQGSGLQANTFGCLPPRQVFLDSGLVPPTVNPPNKVWLTDIFSMTPTMWEAMKANVSAVLLVRSMPLSMRTAEQKQEYWDGVAVTAYIGLLRMASPGLPWSKVSGWLAFAFGIHTTAVTIQNFADKQFTTSDDNHSRAVKQGAMLLLRNLVELDREISPWCFYALLNFTRTMCKPRPKAARALQKMTQTGDTQEDLGRLLKDKINSQVEERLMVLLDEQQVLRKADVPDLFSSDIGDTVIDRRVRAILSEQEIVTKADVAEMLQETPIPEGVVTMDSLPAAMVEAGAVTRDTLADMLAETCVITRANLGAEVAPHLQSLSEIKDNMDSNQADMKHWILQVLKGSVPRGPRAEGTEAEDQDL